MNQVVRQQLKLDSRKNHCLRMFILANDSNFKLNFRFDHILNESISNIIILIYM